LDSLHARRKKTYANWAGKVKFTQFARGEYYPNVGDGTLAYLIPPNEFYSKEPELFSMNQEGSRKPPKWVGEKFYENITMLSLGNPRTFETLSIMRQWCKLTPHVFLYCR